MDSVNFSKYKIIAYGFLINLFDDLAVCWKDNQGSLFPNIKTDYDEYRQLGIDWTVNSINPDDLPKEFSRKTINEINKFRRKTANLNDEWLLYIDYETGEILIALRGLLVSCQALLISILLRIGK